ncbi:MAG TPA: DUF4350 domain-containing protein [Thermoguttaceae bacterium]|nr:DUF4350 domain-containing protein [Thermoguttaceae bacterium]
MSRKWHKQRDAGDVNLGKIRPRRESGVPTADVAWPVVIGAVCGMGAAWVAAGSTGLLDTPLRHALVGLLLGAAVAALRPSWRRLLLVAIVAAAGLAASRLTEGMEVVDALGVAAVLGTLTAGSTGVRRRALLIVATAAGTLALFRAACFAVPTVWWGETALGRAMGWVAGLLSGQSPWIGGSLGGLDLLVVMGVFYVGWLRATPPPRRPRALYALVAILAVQAVYLAALSHATELAAALPAPTVPESLDDLDYRPTDWSPGAELRAGLPWNLPLAAALAQAIVAGVMLRWTRLRAEDQTSEPPLRSGPVAPREQGKGSETSEANLPQLRLGQGSLSRPPEEKADRQNQNRAEPSSTESPDDEARSGRRRSGLLLGAAVLVAGVTATLGVWSPDGRDLSGKTIVGYDGDFDRWKTPVHDALGQGQDASNHYGLLPSLAADLGGQWAVSRELTDEDLKKADVLVVIQPTEAWPKERIERLEQYVRGGGSLLVAAGPTVQSEIRHAAGGGASTREPDDATADEDMRPVNGLLRPMGLAFRDEAAVAPAEAWQGALSVSTHPAVFGVSRRTLGACLGDGCPIDAGWLTRPILVGRWAWGEPAGETLWNGRAAVDAGEAWGDLVLAAERPWGQGTVVALGSYWCLTNLGIADGHELASRLLRYLANRSTSPQAMWRQVLGVLGYLTLFVLIVRRPDPTRLVVIAMIMGIVFTTAMCQAQTNGPAPARPSSASGVARPIVYVDASHLEVGSNRSWANDGVDGFLLTLARNGYLPLKMHRWDPERLKQAALLVVMGPAKSFSSSEIEQMQKFVEGGGCLVCMVGATESAASRTMLDAFQLDVGISPSSTGSKVAEAEPMGEFPDRFGRFATYYLNAKDYGAGDYILRAWFFHAWPVRCTSDKGDWQPLVNGYQNVPLVIHRWFGQGSGKGNVVLIGDSHFVLNFGHGYYDGSVTASTQDNEDFWRWLISRVTTPREWIPPDRSRKSPQGTMHGRGEVMR